MGWKDAPLVEEKPSDGGGWKSAPLVEKSKGVSAPGGSAVDRARQMFGLQKYTQRGNILPYGITEGGETELALPQPAVDMLTSFVLPGHVAKGGNFSPQDVAKFTLDYGAPATSRMTSTRPPVQTKKQFVKSAPTTEELAAKSGAFYKKAKESGVTVKPESYDAFLDGLIVKMESKGFDEDLHPAAAKAMKALEKKRGQGRSVEGLDIAYQQIGDARGASEPGTQRIAGLMQKELNKYVDNLGLSDVAQSGNIDVARDLNKARGLWSRSRKSETINKVIEDANSGLYASGYENGVRIGLRKILRNPKKARGFSADEKKIMADIVNGGPLAKLTRLGAKLSFFKADAGNTLAGSIGSATGAGIGASIAGAPGAYIGAAIPPAIGYGAQKAAEKGISNNVDLLRALAATGKSVPHRPIDQRLIPYLMSKGAYPVAAALNREEESGNGTR